MPGRMEWDLAFRTGRRYNSSCLTNHKAANEQSQRCTPVGVVRVGALALTMLAAKWTACNVIANIPPPHNARRLTNRFLDSACVFGHDWCCFLFRLCIAYNHDEAFNCVASS